MRINKIPSYNTNFTSRVAILAHDGFAGLDNDDILQTEDYIFEREFKRLENNGNDDDVIFDGDCDSYLMTVTEDSEHGRRVCETYISSAEQIPEMYKTIKATLSNGKGTEYPLSGPIAKYLNRVPDKNSSSDSNICISTNYCDKNKLSQFVNNEDFQAEIEKLEKRNEKNTVVFFPGLSDGSDTYMSVAAIDPTYSYTIRFSNKYVPTPNEIQKKYQEALKNRECMDVSLAKYII